MPPKPCWLMWRLASLQVPIPEHMDLYHLQEEAEPTNRTALESVVDYIKAEIDVRLSA